MLYFLSNTIKYYDIVEEVKIKGDFMYNEDRQMRCTYMPNFNFNDLTLEYGIDIKSIKPYIPQSSYFEPPAKRDEDYSRPVKRSQAKRKQ